MKFFGKVSFIMLILLIVTNSSFAEPKSPTSNGPSSCKAQHSLCMDVVEIDFNSCMGQFNNFDKCLAEWGDATSSCLNDFKTCGGGNSLQFYKNAQTLFPDITEAALNTPKQLRPVQIDEVIKPATDIKNSERFGSVFSAGFVYWQTVGGGCTPTDLTVKNQQYWTVTAAGRVKYKGRGIEPLNFSCPVTNLNANVISGDAVVLRLFYQDPDGAGDDFKVKARLMSFSKQNGALSTVCSATSDSVGQWQETWSSCGNIDIGSNLYWVEVVVSRKKASNQVVEFNGVSIEGAIF